MAAPDATLVDRTHHPRAPGRGPLGTAHHQGRLVQGTLALPPERVPLGRLAPARGARAAATHGQLPDQPTRRGADKDGHTWPTSLPALSAARAACPQTQLVGVGDRAADGYALSAPARPVGVHLLVRATQDRGRVDPAHRDQHPAPR